MPRIFVVRSISPRKVSQKLSDSAVKSILERKPLTTDWDVETSEIEESSKFVSTRMRFVESKSWSETPLFAEYRQELEKGNLVRGFRDLESLEEFYETRYSQIFGEMSRSGFSLKLLLTTPIAELPWTVTDRNGMHLFGNQGNHRFAIARILGLMRFPVVLRGAYRQHSHLHSSS